MPYTPEQQFRARARRALAADRSFSARSPVNQAILEEIRAEGAVGTLDQWAAEGRLRTVVMDGAKKVSVTDVICASTGCSRDTAHITYGRMLGDGKIAPVARAKMPEYGRHGGSRTPIPFANAEEVVKVLHALPGNTAFKRNAAAVVVRYLGGDPTLAGEVADNRAAQERLAVEAPQHPARIFGQAVENGDVMPRGAVGQIHAAIEGLRAELQQTHVWTFSKTSKGQRSGRELVRAGIVVGGSDFERLDQDEHVVPVIDWLKERFATDVWKHHGTKFKSLFCLELKRAKLDECSREERRPFVTVMQGEHRLVYTEADSDLMTTTLAALQERFARIADRDDLHAQARPLKQRRISEFLSR